MALRFTKTKLLRDPYRSNVYIYIYIYIYIILIKIQEYILRTLSLTLIYILYVRINTYMFLWNHITKQMRPHIYLHICKTYAYKYIYVYIYVCAFVCVCVPHMNLYSCILITILYYSIAVIHSVLNRELEIFSAHPSSS